MARAIFLDSFSGAAADLPKGKRSAMDVLAVLAKSPRVSTFDLSEYRWLGDAVCELCKLGLIEDDPAEPYPWHRFALTDAGRKHLG